MSKEQLAFRIQDLNESVTLAINQKAKKLISESKNVINLSVGEPDFPTPKNIIEESINLIRNSDYHKYSPVAGFSILKDRILEKINMENNINWPSGNNIVISNGAKQSLYNTIMALVNPGDEVIIFAPYWVSYSEMVGLAGGESIIINSDPNNGFVVTEKELESYITPRTKLIMFSSPNNPTGSIYTEEELRALARVIERNRQILIISDEIYEYINFTGKKHFSIGSIPEIMDQVITINGVSKGYAMTGWRIGYVACAEWIAKGIEKFQSQTTSGACSFSQMVAFVAMESGLFETKKMSKRYMKRRDIMYELLKKIDGFHLYRPDGAFYLFPNISYYFEQTDGNVIINNASDFSMYLLEEALVATVPGDDFGEPDCIRISIAIGKEKLIEAGERIKKAISKLYETDES